jgi:hypothetical protein
MRGNDEVIRTYVIPAIIAIWCLLSNDYFFSTEALAVSIAA